MSSDRFHKAAKDGLLDILKEATRRDANNKDLDGMTPVLWAAFEGRLDALRLLVGRGGDPDKSDQYGNTALHLAAAKGHLQCVDFLVKFGVNLYSLDIDKHSAKDLAAINNRDDILRYLDGASANLEVTDRKKAKAMRELAEKNCEKRIKEYTKRQQKLEQEMNSKPNQNGSSVLSALKHKIWATSQGNLKQAYKDHTNTNTTKFSALVGGTVASRAGAVQKKANALKFKQQHCITSQPRPEDSGFKIGEMESNGKRSIRSLQGVQRDSEVLYVGSFSSNGDVSRRGKIADVFDVDANSDTEREYPREHQFLSRSMSQPDFFASSADDEVSAEVKLQRPYGLFDRPMLGSLAFGRSVTSALSQLHPEGSSIGSSNSTMNSRKNGPLAKSRAGKARSFLNISDSDSDGGTDSDENQHESRTAIQRFLSAWGLEEHLHIFQKQQIDLDTLMLLTESDLKSLGLPLGPFRKLAIAIQERKSALANPGVITDSRF